MIGGRIAEKYRNLGLFRKILALFCVVLFIAISLVSLIFWAGYRALIDAEMGDLARRNVDLTAANVETAIETASNNSKLILANDTVQQLLKSGNDLENLYAIRELQGITRSFMNLTPHVSAVYVFDTDGHYAGVDNYSYRVFSFPRVEKAGWYRDALALKGYFLLTLNGGEAKRLNGDQNVISLVRSVYDLDKTSRLIGTLMLNLKESVFTSCFPTREDGQASLFSIVDGNMSPIVSGGNEFLSGLGKGQRIALASGSGSSAQAKIAGTKAFFASRKIADVDWYAVCAIPETPYATPMAGVNRLYWLLLLLIIVLLSLAATVVNRLFTMPIRELTATMKNVGNGEFKKADIETGNDEIGLLKDTYNAMIGQIETLVARVREEEARKRVAELHALQMQIKPHFLYNTIDTARSLVITGKSEEANVLLRSLGQFFRNSICDGKDVVTLGEEIAAVKNYLIIQKIRYGSMFEARYDIDERLLATPCLKLVLQPLVENALYHGIRPSGRPGVISLNLRAEDGRARIEVSDDGVGMSEETLKRTLVVGNEIPGEYIGLCGTIDRLRLFCGVETPIEIFSEVGKGTTLVVRLPIGWPL